MILIVLNGRLGNNLFQLAFGSILQKETGIKVYFLPKSSMIGKIWYFSRFRNSIFALFPFLVNRFWKISLMFFPKKECNLENQLLDIQPDSNYQDCVLSGYFQNPTYILRNRDFIFDYFRIQEKYVRKFQESYSKYFKSKKVLTIQIRLGDYLNLNFKAVGSKAFVGWDWFNSVLGKIDLDSFDHVFLISDDPQEAQKNLQLRSNNIMFSDGHEITDLQILMNSDFLIISNSSFAWWGAFLNQKKDKVVYAPFNWAGYSAGIEYPSKIMIDEFTWVK